MTVRQCLLDTTNSRHVTRGSPAAYAVRRSSCSLASISALPPHTTIPNNPPAAPAPRTLPAHPTSAPLTTCQTTPGCAFFLARGGDNYRHAARRARLLCGRAYTQQTRSRFAKANAAVVPDCTNAACTAASNTGAAPEESVEHALLHCLRYSAARQALSSTLQSIGISQLTLPSILCATPPPGLSRANRSFLLSCTNRFLDAIDATRTAAIGLLPFDAG
jgi:hypothetical protein